MTDRKDPKQVIPNIDIIDPIGEIRTRAKELWAEAGKPEGTFWTNYFSKAEDDMLAQHGDPSQPQVSQKNHAPPSASDPESVSDSEPVSEEITRIIETSNNRLVSVLAEALKIKLLEHECFCLSKILTTYRIMYTDNETVGPCSVREIAVVFADLASEYQAKFLEQTGVQDETALSFEDRVSYWEQKLNTFASKDEALTYSDRNTIDRLLDRLRKSNQIADLMFQDIPFELG